MGDLWSSLLLVKLDVVDVVELIVWVESSERERGNALIGGLASTGVKALRNSV